MPSFTRPASGSVAIVTGASSGLGREFARALSRRGHVVLAVARRAERLSELMAEARAAGHGRVEPLAVDLTASGAIERIHETARRLGEIGWLINNAGGSTFGRFEQAVVEDERALVRLNVEAVVALTGRVLPELVKARRGIIVQVASSAGLQPTPGWSVYGASKAFVIAFSEALSVELKGSGVSVTALAPGPVATEFFAANAAGKNRKRPRWEMGAEDCVNQALRAAWAGKPLVIPGAMNRIVAFSARYSPRAVVRWVAGRVSLRYIGLPPMPPRS